MLVVIFVVFFLLGFSTEVVGVSFFLTYVDWALELDFFLTEEALCLFGQHTKLNFQFGMEHTHTQTERKELGTHTHSHTE